jgi:PA domain/RING-like zinc finger
LTDDNSTFFLARPAAFGPLLPSKGLSGQLWIGSGFGDDNLGRGGLTAGAEGELGCSDVPGWDASAGKVTQVVTEGPTTHKKSTAKDGPVEEQPEDRLDENDKRSEEPKTDEAKEEASGDGTDDHLHAAPPSVQSKNPSGNDHADIESLQESAEIAGKVVLLSRGGCGFLEKVKWAQRRGGIALIVGDDVPGGPLVTMYAKGDTSNVTIPALFTSHTTAHLLSSLIPPGGFAAASADASAPAAPKQGDKGKTKKPAKEGKPDSRSSGASSLVTTMEGKKTAATEETTKPRRGWFRSLLSFFGLGDSDSAGVSRRPPSSGRHDWVQVEDCLDCESKKKPHKADKGSQTSKTTHPKDDFVIGVQDWRDPDLLKADADDEQTVQARDAPKPKKYEAKNGNPMKGNSIVPGSGEYEKPGAQVDSSMTSSKSKEEPANLDDGWFGNLFGSSDSNSDKQHGSSGKAADRPPVLHSPPKGPKKLDTIGPDHHEGLWVTLTPTNMSSSPFFDTLLVLVVSPLVTLTVVYALLLLRSRIRRRRWRAPKSVVDRLPVRTYHTLSSEASTSALATPISSSPTTPLLQSSSRRVLSRSQSRNRPRSFTTSEVPEQSSSAPLPDRPEHSSGNESEKREAGLAEWRRRYGGRQKECVVCLEEYIDGVSRVMSLPCGHEFHAECM